MIRLHQDQLSKSYKRCYQRLTAVILLGSFLQIATSLPTSGQQAERTTSFNNQASYTYSYTDPQDPNGKKTNYELTSGSTAANPSPLVDPFGRILGCGGGLLPDYTGFSVGIYEPNPNDNTGAELGQLLSLTRTELPDLPNNNIPRGLAPNTENINPFPIRNNPPGVYNFLFDPNRGQIEAGRSYILVINPPPNSSLYIQRRIKIQILDSSETNVIKYLATSLDGEPISTTGETSLEGTTALVTNAELTGLSLLAFQLTINLCQATQIQIIKTGDRVTAEPGDTAIYRLAVKNLADTDLNNLIITDTLPLGFNFLGKSIRGELDGTPVNITIETNGNTVRFRTDVRIPPEKTLNIAYAVQLTNDSQRGTGRNSAIVNAQRTDNGFNTKDGPAIHYIKVRPGITSDCGTIIGRVFVDKNFDGEQQAGEAGVPNAVIYLEDGNRIITDPNGLFSLANVLPGPHTGVLDLSSLPGYTLAPNRKFNERNSQSRLVRLEPGGMVRMNFAVTPTFQEGIKK